MKKAICFLVFAVLLCCAADRAEASRLEIGAKFDLTKLTKETNAEATIVAFVPSLTYDCEYASMLTQSLYYYFDRGLAFENVKRLPRVNIFLVVKDAENKAKSTQNLLGGMNVVYDEKGALFSYYGAEVPYRKNANSTVVLLDGKNKIVHVDAGYRAQGEHLKPLEAKLKKLVGIDPAQTPKAPAKALKIGDPAPDFLVNEGQKLSGMRGDVVLISFYPAAFSGTFPRPLDPEVKPDGKSVEPLKFDLSKLDQRALMTCAIQISGIELKAADHIKTAKRIVVSSSTRPLLDEWRGALRTENIIYANDPDYTVSRLYSSYNPAGYNNRVSVIIDRKGRIAYIDKSFDPGDEAVLEAKIGELLKKGK